MILKIEYVRQVCMIGQGHECCRYLVVGGDGFGCEKHGTFREHLDRRVSTKSMVARGDNCFGDHPEDPRE